VSAGSVLDVSMLIDLGMTEPAARLWKAMHDAPGAGAQDLALLLGSPESAIHEGLDELADLALVRVSRHHTDRLVPIAVEAGIKLLLRAQQAALEVHRKAVEERHDQITRALTVGPSQGDQPDLTGYIEHLTSPDEIQARFEQVAYTATTSTESLMPVSAIPADALAEGRPLDAELLGRGVAMRLLYLEAIRNDAATIGYARDIAALGAHIRTAPVLPHRLFVCDRRIALVPLDPNVGGRGVACVTAPSVVATLIEFFDTIWHHATPLDIGNPVAPGTGLTATERELLTMLAAGSTDEAAAKRLGLSLRTVRRIMADLMSRLEASSRFEAGLKAAKKGWL
jgi:DNA-binding CsgD family transcriptional regulator